MQHQHLVPPGSVPDATRILTNVAYLMGDVTNTLMMDAQTRVERLGFDLKQDCKQRWRMAMRQTELAKRAWASFAREMYALEDAAQACDDSDYFADLILLIADRVGDSHRRQQMVRNMIKRLKSEVHIYDELTQGRM